MLEVFMFIGGVLGYYSLSGWLQELFPEKEEEHIDEDETEFMTMEN